MRVVGIWIGYRQASYIRVYHLVLWVQISDFFLNIPQHKLKHACCFFDKNGVKASRETSVTAEKFESLRRLVTTAWSPQMDHRRPMQESGYGLGDEAHAQIAMGEGTGRVGSHHTWA